MTPADDTDLTVEPRGLWVGVGGDLALILAGQKTVTVFKNAGDGQLIPFRVRRVMATDTTATDIVAVW